MLFDLSSPGRKNVIRVVYAVLALLFLVGFVGFGIGGEFGSGGIIDSLTGNGGGSTAEQFEQQIEDAEDEIEADPTNSRALEQLVTLRFQSGQVQLDVDQETGIPSVNEDARGELEAAVDAWLRYLDSKPAKIDVTTASSAVNSYRFLNDADGAAEAQAVLAEADPSTNSYGTLAFFRFFAGDFKAGDKAAELAIAEAKPAQRERIERQLAQVRKQAKREAKRRQNLPEGSGEAELQDPFGSLSPSGGAVPPTAP